MHRVFAQFGRSIIREWINAGSARENMNGKLLGPPWVNLSVEKGIFLWAWKKEEMEIGRMGSQSSEG